MKKLICICIIMLSFFACTSVFASNTFYDTRGTKYEGVVERMAKLEIINGMNETTYAPNKGVTRAELAKIIVKMKGIEDFAEDIEYKKVFSDVKKNDWYYPYVLIASDLELINGYEDGTFKPNKQVSYAEMTAILLRYLGYTRISEDSPNGWYWNYIVRMREIELNDNVGEFDYMTPAKRGDVAMFAWNALITDRWAVRYENDEEGLTYTYSKNAPIEIYFEDYKFIDNELVGGVVGFDGMPGIVVNEKIYTTDEKVPLYVLGGRVTALYNKNSEALIGVTFDEDYPDAYVKSGPIFYLKEQGYNLSRAKNIDWYGTKENATYAYLIIDKETDEIIRTVYVDASNTILVEKISVKTESGDNDDEIMEVITLNEVEFTSLNNALTDSGYKTNWTDLKAEEFITDLGNGLYVKNTKEFTDVITDLNIDYEIWFGEDKYIVAEDCLCYIYGEEEAVPFSAISKNDYKNVEVAATINIAEEVYRLKFGKTKEDNDRYSFGFVTKVNVYKELDKQSIEITSTDEEKKKINVETSEKTLFGIGDLVAVGKSAKEGSKSECVLVDKDNAFDNDISIKYNYDAKKIKNPMIGEYMVTKDTKYYKVTLKYAKNSIEKIENCKIEKLTLNDLDDLMAYKINLVYDENMEIRTVYAVNEVNKFENQIALVKDVRKTRVAPEEYEYTVSLSITDDKVTGYDITEEEFYKYTAGNIITFTAEEGEDSKITFGEEFKREFIGYNRDLVVTGLEKNTNSIIFNDESRMDLDEDIYNWNNKKINLNNYRFVLAKVNNDGEMWNFYTLAMKERDELDIKVNDRFAIAEIDGVIVIYRGFTE